MTGGTSTDGSAPADTTRASTAVATPVETARRLAAPDRARTVELHRRHLSSGRAMLAELAGAGLETSSTGARVFAEQEEFLDCGGYGVFILGHRHPRVTRAVIDQIHRNPMATRLLLEPTAAVAAEALVGVAPPGLTRAHFVNSGAEAVETAIKLARAAGRPRLFAAVGGFHGKTTGALSLTGRAEFRDRFLPLLPDVVHVPYGDLDAFADVIPADGSGCVVVEPVQGEAGVVVPPPGYLRGLEQLCRRRGALLVLDEVQTGLGRMGAWWGADLEGVRPDLVLVGKNLSGGVIPVSAVLATEEVYRPFDRDPLLHTSTFAASPVAMAAAATSVAVLHEEGLVARADRLGSLIVATLRDLVATHAPDLGIEVRGAGLLIGVEPATAHASGDLVMELLRRRVLVNHSLNAAGVLRLTPPAVLTDADLDWLFSAFAGALAAIAGRHRSEDRVPRPTMEETT